MGIGLEGAGGAQGFSQGLMDVFDRRQRVKRADEQQQNELERLALEKARLAQQDALTRLAVQERTDRVASALDQRQQEQNDKQAQLMRGLFTQIPGGSPLTPESQKAFGEAGIPPEMMPMQQTPDSKAAGVPESLAPPQDMPTIRGLTAIEQQKKTNDDAQDALANDPSTPAMMKQFLQLRRILPQGENPPAELFKTPEPKRDPVADHAANRDYDRMHPLPNAGGGVIQIQTVDADGNPITKVVNKADAIGKDFQKGPSATVANRVASAKAVTQVGEDIKAKLKDPAVAQTLGPMLGRYSTLQDFIGNPPPEFAGLAGEIESFALANMGVHGMRSVQGADQIKKLLNARHTPESLAATIDGLAQFSRHFMENERPTSGASAPSGKPTAADLIKKYGG